MMTKKISLVALMMFLVSLQVRAEESTNSQANSSVTTLPSEAQAAVPSQDIDNEITSARLRAATGAKSKWSFTSSVDYQGASIINPLSTERPKLNTSTNAASPTSLSGNLGIKYRVTTHDHLSMGIGALYIPTYISDKKTGKTKPEQTTFSSPHLDYVRLFRVEDVQNVVVLTASQYTANEDVADKHLLANLYLSHTMLANISNSKFGIGLYSNISQDYFSDMTPEIEKNSMYLMFGLNPLIEYTVNDKLSVRTTTGWLNWAVMYSDKNKAILFPQTQTLGVGIAVKRDIYLYPNIQWKWASMNADNTTVGLSANINL